MIQHLYILQIGHCKSSSHLWPYKIIAKICFNILPKEGKEVYYYTIHPNFLHFEAFTKLKKVKKVKDTDGRNWRRCKWKDILSIYAHGCSWIGSILLKCPYNSEKSTDSMQSSKFQWHFS